MPTQRKLFLAHASELAYLCVRAVESAPGNAQEKGGLVARFVRSYAERYNRRCLSINPERNREFDSTIGREALLVMAAKVYLLLPDAFAHRRSKVSGRGPILDPQEAALSQAFFTEFLASLGRSMEWSPAEAPAESVAFHRDLEMYQRWGARSGSGAAITDDFEQSPFADRCALLLDPAMMEQARRAAAEFEIELAHTAAHMFAKLGRRSTSRKKPRQRARTPRGPRRKIARRRHPRNRKTASSDSRKKKSPKRRKPAARPRRRRTQITTRKPSRK